MNGHTALASNSTLIPLIPTLIISSAIVLLALGSTLDFLLDEGEDEGEGEME